MSNVLQFKLKRKPTRDNVKNWLSINFIKYPDLLEKEIGDVVYHGWRFVRANDGTVYFANRTDPGITEDEVYLQRILNSGVAT